MLERVARVLLAAGLSIAWATHAVGHLDRRGSGAPNDVSLPSDVPSSRGLKTLGSADYAPHVVLPKPLTATPNPTRRPGRHPGWAAGELAASPEQISSRGPECGSIDAGHGLGGAGDAMGGMMGGWMGAGCMGAPRKEFYASLMAMPDLSPEQRQRIEAQARAWISAGTDEIATAENALRYANAARDSIGAEQAALRMREALASGEERQHDTSLARRGKATAADRAGLAQGVR